jgi:hypothetical protein
MLVMNCKGKALKSGTQLRSSTTTASFTGQEELHGTRQLSKAKPMGVAADHLIVRSQMTFNSSKSCQDSAQVPETLHFNT